MNGAFDISPVRSAGEMATIRQLFIDYVAAIGVDLGFQDFAGELAQLPGKYAEPQGALLLAHDGGAPLGSVALRPLGTAGYCEMKRLYVAAAGRGRGVGAALVAAVIAAARERGYRAMLLDTLPGMTAALRLYERAGFVRIAAYYATPLDDAVFLRLALE